MALNERKRNSLALIGGAAAGVAVLALGLALGGLFLRDGGEPASVEGVEVELSSRDGVDGDGALTPPGDSAPADPRASGGREGPGAPPLVAVGPDGMVAPSVTAAAFSRAPLAATDTTPINAADPALLEHKGELALPKIAEDGRMAWRVYARPFASRDDRPRIAVIVTGLGLSPVATEAAIRRLPADVTLAFHPDASDLSKWAEMARRAGHEVLLSVPMEAADFPFDDPGPNALLTSLDERENLARLERTLGRLTGFAGVISVMGSKFSQHEDSLRPVLETLKGRGVMYVAGGNAARSLAPRIATEIGLPSVIVDVVLDDDPSQAAIERQLVRLEAAAREHAVAVGLARPYPVVVGALSKWAATLKQRNIVLAPASALADRQSPP
jgi:polysaccharide deacetylase 2 family uncharacterized protein YibQ